METTPCGRNISVFRYTRLVCSLGLFVGSVRWVCSLGLFAWSARWVWACSLNLLTGFVRCSSAMLVGNARSSWRVWWIYWIGCAQSATLLRRIAMVPNPSDWIKLPRMASEALNFRTGILIEASFAIHEASLCSPLCRPLCSLLPKSSPDE